MSYTGKNFATSGTDPAAFEEKAGGRLVQVVKLDIGDTSNETPVSLANPMPVTGTVAVTGAGDATAAGQDTGNASLASIAAEDFATESTLAALNTKVTAVNTGAVVVSSSALPAGAATETTVTKLTPGSTGTFAAVSVTTSNTALASADSTRKGCTVVNTDASVSLKVAYGFTATATDYSVLLVAGAYLEVPAFAAALAINGIVGSGSITANVTRVT